MKRSCGKDDGEMTTLSIIKHGTCSECGQNKTVFIYREEEELQPPICGQCELNDGNDGA